MFFCWPLPRSPVVVIFAGVGLHGCYPCLKLTFAISLGEEGKLVPEGNKEDGEGGVPEGPDCIGSTVTEPLRSGAACAAPQASIHPVGAALENLRQMTSQRDTGETNGSRVRCKELEADNEWG